MNTRQTAEEIVDWLSDQKYGGENILHAVVCCDFASRQHLIDAIDRILSQTTEHKAHSAPDRYNDELSDGERVDTLFILRDEYIRNFHDYRRRRAMEIAMMVITEPIKYHGDTLGEDWNHPCWCYECRTSS